VLQAGVPNLLDKGVLNVGRERGLHKNVESEWKFLDEIPFDFERRMLSVMLRPAGKADPMLITKVHFHFCHPLNVLASESTEGLIEVLKRHLLCASECSHNSNPDACNQQSWDASLLIEGLTVTRDIFIQIREDVSRRLSL